MAHRQYGTQTRAETLAARTCHNLWIKRPASAREGGNFQQPAARLRPWNLVHAEGSVWRCFVTDLGEWWKGELHCTPNCEKPPKPREFAVTQTHNLKRPQKLWHSLCMEFCSQFLISHLFSHLISALINVIDFHFHSIPCSLGDWMYELHTHSKWCSLYQEKSFNQVLAFVTFVDVRFGKVGYIVW